MLVGRIIDLFPISEFDEIIIGTRIQYADNFREVALMFIH